MNATPIERGKAMLSTIEYAQTQGISGAYPDSSVAKVVGALVAEVERLSSYRSIPPGMVWQDYYSPDDVLKIRVPLDDEIEKLKREYREFASRLDFGDDISEPAASLADMVGPIRDAFSEARDHFECPRMCEQCGERLASSQCPECHGSGTDNAMSANYGAYVECGHCGGAGWIHEGCAEKSYADLVAEVQHVRAAAQTLGRIIERHNRDVLDITGLHHLIDETGDGPWDVVWETLAEGYVGKGGGAQ